MNEEAIYAAVIKASSRAERAALLERACADDVELRQRVEALLEAHDNPDSWGPRAAMRRLRFLPRCSKPPAR